MVATLLQKAERRFASSMIGQRLIEAGYLTEDQLREALAIQPDSGLLLGEICLLKGWLTYPQLQECLPTMRPRLGEKLLGAGLINMNQLWVALLEQRTSGRLLGEILVSQGWLDYSTLAEFVD